MNNDDNTPTDTTNDSTDRMDDGTDLSNITVGKHINHNHGNDTNQSNAVKSTDDSGLKGKNVNDRRSITSFPTSDTKFSPPPTPTAAAKVAVGAREARSNVVDKNEKEKLVATVVTANDCNHKNTSFIMKSTDSDTTDDSMTYTTSKVNIDLDESTRNSPSITQELTIPDDDCTNTSTINHNNNNRNDMKRQLKQQNDVKTEVQEQQQKKQRNNSNKNSHVATIRDDNFDSKKVQLETTTTNTDTSRTQAAIAAAKVISSSPLQEKMEENNQEERTIQNEIYKELRLAHDAQKRLFRLYNYYSKS